MEFDIENTELKNTNTENPDEYLESSVSHDMVIKNSCSVTSVITQITEENGRTQSLITLSDITLSNSNACSSVNVSGYSTEKSLTNNNVSGFLKDFVENNHNNAFITQPEVLFNAPKSYEKLCSKPPPFKKRKFSKCTCSARLRIVHFKYKHPEKNMKSKLGTYQFKTKRNCSNPRQIHKDLRTDSNLIAVTRSRILKKVLAKANLLGEAQKTFFNNMNNDSNILEKEPSEDTLTRINSESSQNDSIRTETAPSVVEIPTKISVIKEASRHTIVQIESENSELSDLSNETIGYKGNENYQSNNDKELINETTFKTDIISVAIAQINNASILKYKTGTSSEQSREEMLYKENLTSTESFMNLSDSITSSLEMPKIDAKNYNFTADDDNKKCIVITDMVNTFDNTSSDTFVVARTSSFFKDNSDSLDISSNQTLTASSELTNQTEPCNVYYQSAPKEEIVKSTLLDTIINVGMFQMPATNSENEYTRNTETSNNIIISDELRKITFSNKVQTTDNFSRNVIQKPIPVGLNGGDRQKNINLPDEDTIRSIITETEKTDKKSCSEEFRNIAPPLEMWDRLIVHIDVTLKRMEDSLLRKISDDLKEALSKFDKYFPFAPTDEHDFLITDNTRSYNKTNESDLSKMESGRLTYFDEGIQCGLVQNEIIDELKAKMKVEGDNVVVEDFPLKLIKSKVIIRNDSFEVLKSPVVPCTSFSRGNGDSLLTTSSEGIRVKKLSKDRPGNRLVMYLTAPIYFIKANMLVITSVPAFFFSIFLLYNFFLLLL